MLPIRVSGWTTISSGTKRFGKGRAMGLDNADATESTDSGTAAHAGSNSPDERMSLAS